MDRVTVCGTVDVSPILAECTRVGSHSGQLHEFRKLEGVIPSQVQILHPPHSPKSDIIKHNETKINISWGSCSIQKG